MIETKTTDQDRGLRCSQCGKNIHRLCATWWITQHGEYCSVRCAEEGSQELHALISKLEAQWAGEAANNDK